MYAHRGSTVETRAETMRVEDDTVGEYAFSIARASLFEALRLAFACSVAPSDTTRVATASAATERVMRLWRRAFIRSPLGDAGERDAATAWTEAEFAGADLGLRP